MIAPIKGKSSLGKSAASQSSPLCIVPDCNRPAKLRGVCQSCYQNATKLVQRGGTTWEELERLGLVQSVYHSPFITALERARASEKRAKAALKKGAKS